MCISYCGRKNIFYHNHFDCSSSMCEHAPAISTPNGCETCTYLQIADAPSADHICGRTLEAVPADVNGCCHHSDHVGFIDLNDVVELPPKIHMPHELGHDFRPSTDMDYYFGIKTFEGSVCLKDTFFPIIYGVGSEHK